MTVPPKPSSTTDYIDVNGARLFIEGAGDGPDLLLVHSGITDSGMWDGQFEAFARNFRTTRYDLRGFGRSSAIEGEYSHVDDLARVVDILSLENPRVVAASMGARVVIDLALRDRGIFDRLLLVGPAVSGLGFEDPALHSCWEELTVAWEAGDIDRMIDVETRFWINGPTRSGDADESVLEHVRAMQRRIVELQPDDDPEIDEDQPASGRLGELVMPILVVVGEHDVSDIHRNATAIQSAAANARRIEIPDTGHLPNMEAIDHFNRLALEFLT